MDFSLNFQPRQIVCLEHEGTCLYAEVIQVVASRQVCWVRPLLLGVFPVCFQPYEQMFPLYDLRCEADLLWPIAFFRPALDTEVMPLLTQLLTLEPQPEGDPDTQQQFRQFIHQVWQAQPRAFQA
jgi:hypothetical protein